MESEGSSDIERRRPRSNPSASARRPLKYGDRFRPGTTTTLELEPVSRGDLVDQEDRPRQRWPAWLTRGAAGVGVVATAVIAVTVGDGSEPAPPAPSETPPAVSLPINDRPPVAPLEVGLIEAEVWDSRGFSYEITMTNRSDTAFDLIDVGPKMSGTELAWDRELVLYPGRETTVRVDFLVLNCLAATSSSAPVEVRMVVRARDGVSRTALAEVPTEDQAALVNASGDAICAQDSVAGGNFTGSGLG